MSSLPGYTLEKYVMWMHDLVVEGDGAANWSMNLAEALGTATKQRDLLTREQFSLVLTPYEPYRELIEDKLAAFDEDTQSWRQYSSSEFDVVPDSVWQQANEIVKSLSVQGGQI